MKLDEFTFSLALLAFPGIITYLILKRIAPKHPETGLQAFLKIFAYSISAYLVFSLSYWLYQWAGHRIFKYNAPPDAFGFLDHNKIENGDILGATVTAIVLSFVYSSAITYNWLNWFAQKIRVSKMSGDLDTWSYFHNLPDKLKNKGWVYVRDHEKEIIYYGAIVGWSDLHNGNKELVLSSVDVYKEKEGGDVEHIYRSDLIYLNKKPEHLSIEAPTVEKESNEQREPEQQK